MKPAADWIRNLGSLPAPSREVERVEGRAGDPTLRVGGVYLHSRYNPRDEAKRFVDSAGLDGQRPVLVVGVGMGYHVLELASRGMDVAAVEPNSAVLRHALDGPLANSTIPIAAGELSTVLDDGSLHDWAERLPQILVHPATATVEPVFCAGFGDAVAERALGRHRLSIAIVGPLYGGSLPIAGYLERAFRSLGHRTLLVDNASAWELYQATERSVKAKRPKQQLTAMLTQFLSEWSYARVAEFGADVCIVLAQAPVNALFPARLFKDGVVTAYWFVENWRHMPYWRDIAPLYDYFFHIQPGEFDAKLQEAGSPRQAFVQTACDPEIHAPVTLDGDERDEFACDISFAGAPYLNRVQMFQGLTDYDFKIWGPDWPGRELQRLVQRPGQRFTPELFRKIVAGSAINVNLHSSATHEGIDPCCDAINPRVFEIAACGGFQLCDPAVGLDRLFEFESEVPVYRSLVELRERIGHYLAHPDERAAIAAAARARALRDHTYEHRAQQMLDLLLKTYGQRLLRKGVRIQRSAAEVSARLGGDSALGTFLGTLPNDVLVTQESINAHLEGPANTMSYPEKVFIYLREVRNFAEALFAERR